MAVKGRGPFRITTRLCDRSLTFSIATLLHSYMAGNTGSRRSASENTHFRQGNVPQHGVEALERERVPAQAAQTRCAILLEKSLVETPDHPDRAFPSGDPSPYRCPCISSFLDPGSSPWGESYHGSRSKTRRPVCSVWQDDGHSPKPVGRSLILTAEKWRFAPIGERTWDKGGHVHERCHSTCADTCLQPAVPVAVAVQLAARPCRSGHFEEDGSAPPFASRIGTAGQADVHCRAIAWGGRSPSHQSLAGRLLYTRPRSRRRFRS